VKVIQHKITNVHLWCNNTSDCAVSNGSGLAIMNWEGWRRRCWCPNLWPLSRHTDKTHKSNSFRQPLDKASSQTWSMDVTQHSMIWCLVSNYRLFQ